MKIDKKQLIKLTNKPDEDIIITQDIINFYFDEFKSKSTGSNKDKSRLWYLTKLMHLTRYKINPVYIQKALDPLPYNNNVKNLMITYIKTFLKWMNQNFNLCIKFDTLTKYEPQATFKQALTRNEINNLFLHLKNYNHPQFELAFHMLLTNGMRLSELFSVDWSNIQNNYCYIKTKKQKGVSKNNIRIAYLNSYVQQIYKQHGFNLSYASIQKQFQLFCSYLKIHYPSFNKHLSAHILRHTFATLMYENNIPLPTISKLIGHSSLEMTMNTYIKNNPVVQIQYFKMFELLPSDVLDIQLLRHENYLLKKLLIEANVQSTTINELRNKIHDLKLH